MDSGTIQLSVNSDRHNQKEITMSVINQSLIAAVVKSFEGEAKAIAKARAIQDKAIQGALDAMWIACDKPKAEFLKGNAKTNEARAQIKEMFDAIAAAGYISKSSAASYQSAFWIAFEQGIEFSRDLNNKKDKADGGDTGGAKPPVTGGVTSTSRTDLDKTLTKALAQARLLGLTDFAADLLDMCLDRLDNFQETVLAKK
jgi:hypothetical protein